MAWEEKYVPSSGVTVTGGKVRVGPISGRGREKLARSEFEYKSKTRSRSISLFFFFFFSRSSIFGQGIYPLVPSALTSVLINLSPCSDEINHLFKELGIRVFLKIIIFQKNR